MRFHQNIRGMGDGDKEVMTLGTFSSTAMHGPIATGPNIPDGGDPPAERTISNLYMIKSVWCVLALGAATTWLTLHPASTISRPHISCI